MRRKNSPLLCGDTVYPAFDPRVWTKTLGRLFSVACRRTLARRVSCRAEQKACEAHLVAASKQTVVVLMQLPDDSALTCIQFPASSVLQC